MKLTREEFEEILDQKLDAKFAIHTKEIKSFVVEHVDKKIDDLAVLMNNGFQHL